jgi:hypothetical protein
MARGQGVIGGQGGSKRCGHCGLTKPAADYCASSATWDGLRRACRACDRAWRKRKDGQDAHPAEVVAQAPAVVEAEVEAPAPAVAPAVEEAAVGESTPAIVSAEVSSPKVIGRIGGQEQKRVTEVALDPLEEAAKKLAEEYAAILNRRLPVRLRAHLMIKIAKNIKGGNAALALKALQDINLATRVVSRSGAQIDLGPLFVLPEGEDISMGGGGSK